jgi:hypothetical protein
MASKIQIRRDTLANWTSNNPVLSSGETAFVLDENKFKVGNGSSAFINLPYLDSREAEKLKTSRVIQLSGDVSGSVTFDGSASVNISTEIQPDSVALGSDTTGNYVSQITGSGNGISVTGSGESASVVIQNTGVTSLTGTGSQVSVSASAGSVTLSLPATINVNTSGNSATATKLDTARAITLTGDVTGTANFDGSASAGIAATLANSGVSAGTYRSVTVNAKGLVTGGTNPTTLSGYGITDALSNSATSTQNGYFGDIFLYDDSTPSHYLGITNSANLTAARTLSINVNDANRTVSLSGDLTVSSAATISGTNTGDQTITLTGDVTGTGTGSFATTLANTAVTPASYGSASAVPTFTVDSKGRLTAASNTTIAIAQSAVTNLTTDLGLKANLASPALSGTPTAPTAAANTNTTQIATTAFVVGQAGTANPLVNGAVAVGTSLLYSRQDHVHPTDTTRAALNSPTFTGTPAAPTAAVDTNTTQIATTAFVVNQASSTNPVALGTAAVGTSLRYARQDHVHPTTGLALLSGATFTGSIIAPAATTSIPSIRIPHGTAPSSPTNGDIWTTTTGLFGRINSTTQEFATKEYVDANAGGGFESVMFLAGM